VLDVEDGHDENLPPSKEFQKWNLRIRYIHGVNLSSVDLNLLVVLDALLEEGSVTAAARRVGLSQPALSNALARLRDAVGDPLFVRDGRGLTATTRARELAAPVRRALAELSNALAPRTPFDPTRSERTFTLAMPDIAELVLVPPLAIRLRREAPGVTVRIVPCPAARPREVLSGSAAPDLVVAMTDATDPSAYQAKLASLHFVCLVRRAHPRVGKRISMARFLELEHVLVAPTGTPRGLVDDLLAARGRERRVALTLGHFFSAAIVVSRTDLVMSATSVLARVAERILPVRSVRHPIDAAVTISQSWHPNQHDDPAHRWFRALLADVARSATS
jgi:DNA-binding transcriptional LysR family regulator